MVTIKRNEPCICGSGIKYKKCCGKVNKTVVKIDAERMLICLVHLAENEVNIPLKMFGQIPVDAELLFDRTDDMLNIKLVRRVKEPKIVTPDKKIVTISRG